uniref:Uncharacterized protein n=1 Tax=Rhizophora mucronata TaxID=61149 RepID=A0A2P2PUA4_RHIMU
MLQFHWYIVYISAFVILALDFSKCD